MSHSGPPSNSTLCPLSAGASCSNAPQGRRCPGPRLPSSPRLLPRGRDKIVVKEDPTCLESCPMASSSSAS